jgi:NADPH-dependent ferric siderophore reductase
VDETGLPAAARWLDELRPGARALLLAEVAGPREELALTSHAEVTASWLHRNQAADGALERAVRDVELPPGDGFVWVAGEAGALKPIRRYLRDELCLDSARFAVAGYWKRGVADHNHQAEAG